jgi:hypothetical protein
MEDQSVFKTDKDARDHAPRIVKDVLRLVMRGPSISPEDPGCPRVRAQIAVRVIAGILLELSEAHQLNQDLKSALWDLADGSEPALPEDLRADAGGTPNFPLVTNMTLPTKFSRHGPRLRPGPRPLRPLVPGSRSRRSHHPLAYWQHGQGQRVLVCLSRRHAGRRPCTGYRQPPAIRPALHRATRPDVRPHHVVP